MSRLVIALRYIYSLGRSFNPKRLPGEEQHFSSSIEGDLEVNTKYDMCSVIRSAELKTCAVGVSWVCQGSV